MCERNINWLSLTHPNQGPSLQPRHDPDWELNQQPFSLQDNDQPIEPHQSGKKEIFNREMVQEETLKI